MKGRGGCVRSLGHEHDCCQAGNAENTDLCTNCAVKYATARGHLTYLVGAFVWWPCPTQKNPRVRKIRVRNSGTGNGSANFMGAWKNALFLQDKPCP